MKLAIYKYGLETKKENVKVLMSGQGADELFFTLISVSFTKK